MVKEEISKEEEIQQLNRIINTTEKYIQSEMNIAIKEDNDMWDDIIEYCDDEEFKKVLNEIFTPEELNEANENQDKIIEQEKIRFKAELDKNTIKEIKYLNALKRKLKRLKEEKPKPSQKFPEVKSEPLI